MNGKPIDISKDEEMKSQEAVIYARTRHYTSFDKRAILLDQIKPLRRYARQNGLQVVREFTDSAPANRLDRKGLVKMFHFLRNNPAIKTVIVCSFDRLCRDLKNYLILEDLIKNLGLKIITPQKNKSLCLNVTLNFPTGIIQPQGGARYVQQFAERTE